ncbi:hypothetical protein DCC85_20065 [Paenibacillus sp. CAA11]|uniref:hypothetical protein n=1 Tax=Paenibacillus sp. CAA11 TaxID=1532905 RepID=UPI000D3748C7|nr:hypothetical protein [Paenibacillus sp. CAA11]AWB46228.1 hypothetical protein DCC85_20065 [Paenibacillus sp. CAA11]
MVNHDPSAFQRILEIYKLILSESATFDEYTKYSEELDQLYIEVGSKEPSEEDSLILEDIKVLHERIIQLIMLEKEKLSQEIVMFEKRKRMTQDYGKLSNNYDVGAFFVDFKK